MSSEWKKHPIEEEKLAANLGYQIGYINTHVKPLTYSIEKPKNHESELTKKEFDQIKILEGKNTKTVPMHFVELTEEIERAAIATYISKEYPNLKAKHSNTIIIFNNGALELIDGMYNREHPPKWQELIDDVNSDEESDDDEFDDEEFDDEELEPSIKPPIRKLKEKHNEQKKEIKEYLRTQKNIKTIVFLDKRAKILLKTNSSIDCTVNDFSTQPDALVEYEKKHFYTRKKTKVVGPMPDPIPFPWFEGLDGDIRVICLKTEEGWIKNIDEFLSPLMQKEKIGLPFVYFGIDKFCYIKKDEDKKIVFKWTNFDHSGPEWFSVVNQFLAAVSDINSFFLPSLPSSI